MLFKPLPPGIAQRLIQGHPDALTPLVKERDFSIKNSKCLRCGGAMQTRMHPNFLFSGDDPLPRTVAYCVDCHFTTDPKTGLILDTGSYANLQDRPKPPEEER
jgi:hypothetical protein